MQELSLQGVITLNNIRFHKAKTGLNFYGFGGIAGMTYYRPGTMHWMQMVLPYNFSSYPSSYLF